MSKIIKRKNNNPIVFLEDLYDKKWCYKREKNQVSEKSTKHFLEKLLLRPAKCDNIQVNAFKTSSCARNHSIAKQSTTLYAAFSMILALYFILPPVSAVIENSV